MNLILFHHTENSVSCCKIEIFCPSILKEELAIMVQFLYSGRIYCQDQNLIPKICKNLTQFFGFPPVMKFIKMQNCQQNSSQLQPIRKRQKELISDSLEKLSSNRYKNENHHTDEELVRKIMSKIKNWLLKSFV